MLAPSQANSVVRIPSPELLPVRPWGCSDEWRLVGPNGPMNYEEFDHVWNLDSAHHLGSLAHLLCHVWDCERGCCMARGAV